MGAGLGMDGDDVRARLDEGFDIGIDRGDHQMDVHHALDVLADGRASGRAESDVGDVMAVHDVDMDPIAALGLDGAAFGAEIGEIGGKDRRGDLDAAVEGFHGRFLKSGPADRRCGSLSPRRASVLRRAARGEGIGFVA